MSEFQWCVVYVKAGSERKVKRSIIEQSVKLGLEDCFSEILIPSESTVETGQDGKTSRKSGFPGGYIYLNLQKSDNVVRLVNAIPEVLSLQGDKLNSVRPEEIKKIREAITQVAQNSKADLALDNGDWVEILDGPFESFKGQIDSINKEKNKVIVIVSVLGNDTHVTLSLDQIKKS